VFGDQSEFQAAFEAGELSDDLVAVVRYQGPKANGMPELHKLITPLGVLQDRGHRVALVTDGRMSGASGKIPAAIHVTPEAAAQESPLSRVCDGDRVRLDAEAGTIEVLVDATEFAGRPAATPPDRPFVGTGRELFESFRHAVGPADAGASIFGDAA
jgi:phosphogluconate dehydratase